MPGGSRSTPPRPSLRYLKLEAKRRLAAGEFATSHDAQAAIAREDQTGARDGLEAVAFLRSRVRDHRTYVVLTSRAIAVDVIDGRLRRSWLTS